MKNILTGLLFCALGFCLSSCASSRMVFKKDYDYSRVKSVAIIKFQDAESYPNSGSMVSNLFAKYLLQAGYNVVERDELQKIIDEMKLSVGGYITPSQLKQIGQLCGVDAIITGTVPLYNEQKTDVVLVNVREVTTFVKTTPVERSHPDNASKKESGGDKRPNPGAPRNERPREQEVTTETTTTVTDKQVPETVFLSAKVGITCKMIDVETGQIICSGSDTNEGVNSQAAGEYLISQLTDEMAKVMLKK